jgi:hypothetical protein
VQQPFFSSGEPWPFHICCQENLPLQQGAAWWRRWAGAGEGGRPFEAGAVGCHHPSSLYSFSPSPLEDLLVDHSHVGEVGRADGVLLLRGQAHVFGHVRIRVREGA